MDLQDLTKNQHFVSQVEQRLNSLNPLAKEGNQRIYSFSLQNRESHAIHLDSDKGAKISNTLILNNIFSFEVLKKEVARYNFEKLFHQYEVSIRENTNSLLSKLPNAGVDIKSEILNIFISKFLNFVRNPYSIKKVLNTFPRLSGIKPTDPVHYKNFERVLNGRKPQQKYLCNKLGVTEDDYIKWLSVIFLLLVPFEEEQPNFLDKVVRSLYEDQDLLVMIYIYTYDDKTCLLSDRGYSIPLPENKYMAWDFNLYSNGFIRYIFGNIDLFIPQNVPVTFVERVKSVQKSITVHSITNDLNALKEYNKNVVYQCKKSVFNSSSECYGL